LNFLVYKISSDESPSCRAKITEEKIVCLQKDLVQINLKLPIDASFIDEITFSHLYSFW